MDGIQPNKSLSVMSWNCNSIAGKSHHLDYMIYLHKPDIIALTETKLNPNICDSEIISNYTVYRRDRSTGQGGGVLIAISDTLNIKVLDYYVDIQNEIISLDLNFRGFSFVIACYYRPLNIKSVTDIIDWHEKQCNPNVMIVGDFNLPEIDWDSKTLKSTRDSHMHGMFLDFLCVNDLSQFVLEPTHKLGNILDLVVTNMDISTPVIDLSTSDHSTVFVNINVPFENVPLDTRISKTYYKFEDANLETLSSQSQNLENFISSQIHKNETIDTVWNTFKTMFTEITKSNIPNYPVKCRKKHWITRRTITQINKRKRMKKTLRRHYSLFNAQKLEDQSDYCKKLVNDDYNDYINVHICDKLAQGNSKPLFKFIANKKGQNNTIKCIENSKNDQDIAEKFVEAFTSVFTYDDGLLPTLQATTHQQDKSISVTEQGVLNLLISLDPTKGAGPDNLPPALLKFMGPYIYKVITAIFNFSLAKQCVPVDWKTANVVPIHKKGARNVALNYRPISLTSVLCKTMEHIIAHNIHSYLDEFNILYKDQHGFRPGHGCDTQLLNTISDFIDSYDSNIISDLIVLDFSKAFDVVSHPKLIHKLKSIGIHSQTVGWIKHWLSNRTHQVTVNGVTSNSHLVTSGVPQGSVLGPLLFLIYINDMPNSVLNSKLKLFADDSLLYNNIKSDSDMLNLQLDLNCLVSWSESWQMKFNANKCETMRISRPKNNSISDPSYHIENDKLASVEQVKYLGINIDNKLTFDAHIKDICRKASNNLHMLMRSLKRAKTRTRITAYKSICRPILEYATIVWSPHKQKMIKLLEAVNRKAFRWCFKKRKYDFISQLMAEAEWHTLKSRRETTDMKMYHKIMSGSVNIDIDRFSLNQSSYNTRKGAYHHSIQTNVQRFSFKHRIFRKLTN